MDKFKSMLQPKSNPQQQLRDWQRKLRQECRNIERQILDVQREGEDEVTEHVWSLSSVLCRDALWPQLQKQLSAFASAGSFNFF